MIFFVRFVFSQMNEKLIEKKLREAVTKAGGLALKFVSPGFTGVPDRIVMLPGERLVFVELKSTGKKLEARQQFVKNQFWMLGFDVWVIDNENALNNFLKTL